MGNLNETPSANRLHIGIYGKTNSGKSSLINAVTKQEVSIVADVAGTTTDPVYKPMEIHPLGPCVIIDTAGFDDDSELGERRVENTVKRTLSGKGQERLPNKKEIINFIKDMRSIIFPGYFSVDSSASVFPEHYVGISPE